VRPALVLRPDSQDQFSGQVSMKSSTQCGLLFLTLLAVYFNVLALSTVRTQTNVVNSTGTLSETLLKQSVEMQVARLLPHGKVLNEYIHTNLSIPIHISSKTYNLASPQGKKDGYWSQAGQDKIVDKLLQGRRGLFFIESGGYDGEEHSNSLFLEMKRGWRGMVIEPNPHLYSQIRMKGRQCMTVNGAISPNGQPDTLPFVLAGPLGGFTASFSEQHRKRLRQEISQKKGWMHGKLGSGDTVMVPAYPLEFFLKSGNQTSLVVDYWSLDTEGSEASILSATNFSHLTVGIMSIEHNAEHSKQRGIQEALRFSGLVLYRNIAFDYIYVNPVYFRDRGIKMPILEASLV